MDLKIAYLAGGKLHLKAGDAPIRTVESEFGQSLQERMLAVFQFLNLFTNMFTGKPLMVAGQSKPLDIKPLKVWGGWIDPVAALRQSDRTLDKDGRALVPKTWQLIRQKPDQEPEVLGESVLAYDVAANGVILYSNGSAIYAIAPDGNTEKILTDKLIEQVAIVDD